MLLNVLPMSMCTKNFESNDTKPPTCDDAIRDAENVDIRREGGQEGAGGKQDSA